MAIYGVLDGRTIVNIIDISERNTKTWPSPLVAIANSGAGIGCSYDGEVFYDASGAPIQNTETALQEATDALAEAENRASEAEQAAQQKAQEAQQAQEALQETQAQAQVALEALTILGIMEG